LVGSKSAKKCKEHFYEVLDIQNNAGCSSNTSRELSDSSVVVSTEDFPSDDSNDPGPKLLIQGELSDSSGYLVSDVESENLHDYEKLLSEFDVGEESVPHDHPSERSLKLDIHYAYYNRVLQHREGRESYIRELGRCKTTQKNGGDVSYLTHSATFRNHIIYDP